MIGVEEFTTRQDNNFALVTMKVHKTIGDHLHPPVSVKEKKMENFG